LVLLTQDAASAYQVKKMKFYLLVETKQYQEKQPRQGYRIMPMLPRDLTCPGFWSQNHWHRAFRAADLPVDRTDD